MSTTTSRKAKWHPTPPPPPSPQIFRFPRSRRTRRKQPNSTPQHRRLLTRQNHLSSNGKYLENLIDRGNDESFKPNEHDVALSNNESKSFAIQRRDRIGEEEKEEDEKWRFQSEILRAECNLLRIERDFASKKLEKNRIKMEQTLRSAVQALVSGRQKIYEGKNVNAVLEEEIEGLAEKLEEVRKSSSIKDNEARKGSSFDRKSCLLQHQLQKHGGLSDMSCVKEFQELSESNSDNENAISTEEPSVHVEKKCSGQCKAIVRKIVEQVRAETEQWSQMQEMLVQVRVEMEELRLSRDFWEDRAHNSDHEIQSLKLNVEEWKDRALGYEIKADELQLELSVLKNELRKSKTNRGQNGDFKSKDNHRIDEKSLKFENAKKEFNIEETKQDSRPVSLAKQLSKEKKMLLRHLKEKRRSTDKDCTNEISADGRRKIYANGVGVVGGSGYSPLRNIGNSMSLARENGADFPFHSTESSRRRESFRK
ncbi:hypothetical protein BUALT_Bualt13G0038900 [Buddleja alternifolia]|uniref:Uncharacterized protein n=1 Tax=Buddleja alternifolia TaxID=168488 RepID=A0AAV6WVG4_9LAMI|nr:hypothetical protein BUALT_Bualt13G0038900 [Buddleja alternifolia]